MADIELVIKIPEKYFKDDTLIHFFGCYSQKLDDVIKNSVVLPKGHGRLIDADALIFNADYYEPLISKRDFDFAPTIIEADKAESEDKE